MSAGRRVDRDARRGGRSGQGQLRRSPPWAWAAEPAAELWLRSVSMLGLSALAMGGHGEASPGSGAALLCE